MADKATTNAVQALKQQIAGIQKERDEWANQLPELEEAIAGGGPEAEEAAMFKVETETTIANQDKELAKLRADLAALEATLPKAPEPAIPKFDPEKHPLLKKVPDKDEPAKPVVFNAGDLCEAQWSDKQWYKVKVQTVLGSLTDPKYHVRFIDYGDSTLTVGREKIRPLVTHDKKHTALAPTTASVNHPPHVISGPASVNPKAAAKKLEGDANGHAPTKRRTIGGSKQLERKAADWQNFQKKGPGKKLVKKDSQFRTPAGPNARVGFTGSGSGMTQAPKRMRYNTKALQEAAKKEEKEEGLRRDGDD